MLRHRFTKAAWALLFALAPAVGWGADAYPLFTDPNSDGLSFGGTDAFVSGQYGLDVGGPFVVYNQNFVGGNDGAGISVSISNGENNIDETFDDSALGDVNAVSNPDIPNTEPANSVFADIGNASGKLENGNVLRFSVWVQSDPANPITVAPQIEPVVKFEFWKEGLSTFQDTSGGVIQPGFGDKVFDIDQSGNALNIPVVDRAQWIDIDGNGSVIDGLAAGQGRISSITTDDWTLVEVTHTVNDFDWLGIDDDLYTVADIEEIRAVMFLGDFAGTNLTGDGDGGNLLLDNVLVEVFADAASVTSNANPKPPALSADFNGDGIVDLADYTVFRDGLGAGFDEADYNTWLNNFGNVIPSAAAAAAVPEPGSAMLLMMTLGWGLRRRPANR